MIYNLPRKVKRYTWYKYSAVDNRNIVTASTSSQVAYSYYAGDLPKVLYYGSVQKSGGSIVGSDPIYSNEQSLGLSRYMFAYFNRNGSWYKNREITYDDEYYGVHVYAYRVYLDDNWAKGTTNYGTVTSTDETAYPEDGYQDGYWYVKRPDGIYASELAVGSTVKLNVNGVATDFIVVHQGLPSSLYDDSCDGTWLLMKDIYEYRAWDTAAKNRYRLSTITENLNNAFIKLFDSKVQDIITQVKIPYCSGNGSDQVSSGVNGMSVKSFLLSGFEVGWTKSTNIYFPIDGVVLDYFQGTEAADAKRIAYKKDGTLGTWWLRSPATYSSSDAWKVGGNGARSIETTSDAYGIRPALILPSDALFDETTLTLKAT